MSARATKKDPHCPHCVNTPMGEQTWGGVPVRICMRCGANFFAAGSLAAWEGWRTDVPAEAERNADRRTVGIHCPDCGTAMQRLTFPLAPPLEFERCPGCQGILLDFEEIRRIPEVGAWAAGRAKARVAR